jgi:hypothetical protein
MVKFLVPLPILKLEDHPCQLTIYVIYSQLTSISGGCFLHSELKEELFHGDKGPLGMVLKGFINFVK